MKNILLSVADDQRWDMVGAIGDRRVRTPIFDALAANGTAFTNARCQNGDHPAVCIPSRAALHTGRGVREVPMDCSGFPTLGETLRRAGYVSHGVGKWHNGCASYQRSFGGGGAIFFEAMHGHIGMPLYRHDPSGVYDTPVRCGKFSSVAFADAAIEFLDHHDPETPFFLYLAWTSPHDPRTPPPEFARLYDADSLELPPNFMPDHPFDNGELDVRDEWLAPHPRTPAVIRRHLADYFGMVSELDAQFGRVIGVLRARGFLDNTLVIHTADHGLAVGQHGLMGKQNLYEHSVRVPMLLQGPGVARNKRIHSLCHGFDLAPTILDWAGVPIPDAMTARSLRPALERDEPIRRTVTAVYKNLQQSVTDGRWKLIRYTVRGTTRTQLFDLESDPWEIDDLSENHPEIVSRLVPFLPSFHGD